MYILNHYVHPTLQYDVRQSNVNELNVFFSTFYLSYVWQMN